jgi:hypothetical protein
VVVMVVGGYQQHRGIITSLLYHKRRVPVRRAVRYRNASKSFGPAYRRTR